MNAVKADERHSELLIPIWSTRPCGDHGWLVSSPSSGNASGERLRWPAAQNTSFRLVSSDAIGPVWGQSPRRFAAVFPDQRLIEIECQRPMKISSGRAIIWMTVGSEAQQVVATLIAARAYYAERSRAGCG